MSLLDFLKYGALGLGLALAILTYRLLSKEQVQTTPRGSILAAIYVFMIFSLVLAGSGFIAERFPLPRTPEPLPPRVPPAISVSFEGPLVEYRWINGEPPPLKKPVPRCKCYAALQLPLPHPLPFPEGSIAVFANQCPVSLDVTFVRAKPRKDSALLDPSYVKVIVPAKALFKVDLGGAVRFADAVFKCPA